MQFLFHWRPLVNNAGRLWPASRRPFSGFNLLVMKLTTLFLLACSLQLAAKVHSQTITYRAQHATLKEVFAVIKVQTGYVVFYDNDDIGRAGPVLQIAAKNQSLPAFLQEVLKGQPYTFTIEKKNILVSRKETVKPKATPATFFTPPPATHDLRVHITDSLGSPLQGASVVVKGTKQGGQTDADGNITLAGLTGNEILVISFVGYETKEINVGNNTVLSIVLKASPSPLDEMQVIAYGQTTKRLSLGNISTVKKEDIENSPVPNVLLAVAGRVPGIFIQQQSGVPGSGVRVQIQGQNSISSGNDPLYVIDGVPYPAQMLPGIGLNIQRGTSPLNYLNPQDIESVDILKDADATAIYGSRAANGAILITTRKGRAGPLRATVNFQNGFGQVAKKIPMMNTEQYLAMRKEAYVNDGLPVPDASTTPATSNYDLTVWDQNRYTDWQKVLIGGHAQYLDAQGTVSGGNDQTQFLLGTNFHRETTVFPGNSSNGKGAVYFNGSNTSPNKRFKVQVTGNYMFDQTDLPGSDLTGSAIELVPNAPALYDAAGNLNWAPLPNGVSTWRNPLANTLAVYSNKTNNLVANADISYEILSGLVLKSNFGYNRLESEELSATPQTYFAPEQRTINRRKATYSNREINTWNIEPQLTYRLNKSFGKFDFLLGTTFQKNKSHLMAVQGSGYTSDAQLNNIAAATTLTAGLNLVASEYNYNALFGRISYNLQDKYLVDFTFRRDGSSRFGSENLFHNFYAAGLGWIFSEEKWVKENLSFFSFGKLKISYGTTGNDQIGDYQFMTLYNIISVNIPYTGNIGTAPAGLSNPFLQWEETRKANLGLDLGFLDNRISLNANYYRNRSSNQLQGYLLPIITGFNYVAANLPALVQNSGLEASLKTENIRAKNFTWTTNLNLTINRNQLVKYPGMDQSSYSYGLIIGKPLGITKIYKFGGVDPQTGIYRFVKADGSLTNTPVSPADQTATFDKTPAFYGGFENSITYRRVTLDFLFQFVKQKALDPLYFGINWPGLFSSTNNNQPVSLIDRLWSRPGDNSEVQKATTTSAISSQNSKATSSDAVVRDASYIRLKNVSLSWALPGQWMERLHIQQAKLYMLAQNLLTLTHFPVDPESGTLTNLPPLRVITLGAQLSF